MFKLHNPDYVSTRYWAAFRKNFIFVMRKQEGRAGETLGAGCLSCEFCMFVLQLTSCSCRAG
jgi:hypothetical protein